jgi:LemA protein
VVVAMEWFFMFTLLGSVVAVCVFGVVTYNDLVRRRNKVKNSWAHIDAQLQRRFDLIPNLVETIKGCTTHERQILENITAALNEYIGAHTNTEKLTIDAQLSSYLKSLYAMAETSPQLKTNRNFLQLQNALTEIEEDISYARQFYNDAVTIYNNKLMTFPSNVIASKCGFKEETLFDAVKDAEVAPTIECRTAKYTQCPVCGATVHDNSINCEYCGCSVI